MSYGPKTRNRDFLVSYLRPQWPRVVLLAGLLLAVAALELVRPQILRVFIDGATSGQDLNALIRLAGLFFAAAVLGQIAGVAETFVAENVGLTATNQLRSDLTRHCLDLDLAWHRFRTPGELIERIDGDVANLSNFFARFVVQLVGNAILLVSMLALLFAVHALVGAAIAAFAALSLVVLYRLRNVGVPHWDAARQASAILFGFLEERLAGSEDIRSSRAVDDTLTRLAERSETVLRSERFAAFIGSITGNTGNLLLMLTTVVGLALSLVLFRDGAITIGTAYLVFSYTQLLARPIEQMTRQFQDFQKAAASLARIRALLDTRGSLNVGGRRSLPGGPLAVDLDQVTFGYDEGPVALRNVTLSVQPGEVVGLLGRTGSGKTSLSRLLCRFYDPSAGSIRVGGVDLRDVAVDDTRRAVAIVTQDVHLFHASLRDNLTLFDPTVPDARIEAVLREIGLGDWLANLADGLDSRLVDGGHGLSAGEAQLLAFARAFLRDPGLIILDEASSRLDPATERQIEAALDRLLAGRTAIVIAHRLATVERADTIVVLEDGAVVERGPRATLARDPSSRFAGLLAVGLEEVLS